MDPTTLTLTREAIAAALNALGVFNVSAYRPSNIGVLDGWITVRNVRPADFTNSDAQFEVVLTLTADEIEAETMLDLHSVNIINAITTLAVSEVSLEPQLLAVGNNAAPLYSLVLTVTMEVN